MTGLPQGSLSPEPRRLPLEARKRWEEVPLSQRGRGARLRYTISLNTGPETGSGDARHRGFFQVEAEAAWPSARRCCRLPRAGAVRRVVARGLVPRGSGGRGQAPTLRRVSQSNGLVGARVNRAPGERDAGLGDRLAAPWRNELRRYQVRFSADLREPELPFAAHLRRAAQGPAVRAMRAEPACISYPSSATAGQDPPGQRV